MSSSASMRLFLIAENRLLREALAKLLSADEGILLVGSVPLSTTSLVQITASKASVLLIDCGGSPHVALHFLSQAREAIEGLRTVVIGMDRDTEVFFRAVRAGATGYLEKDASAGDVVAAVRAVANGEAMCPGRLCLALFERVAQQDPAPIAPKFGLTRREAQLLPLIARGLTNKEIASSLNLSEQTVKNHIHNILRKLGKNDRLEIAEVCGSAAGALRAAAPSQVN